MAQVIIEGETISQQEELEKLDGDEYLILQKGSENKKTFKNFSESNA